MPIERFGSVGGAAVDEIALANGTGASARILTWGAVVRDLVVPSAQGRQRVVLGLNSIEDYLAHSPYFGAIVGRYANRIGGGRFHLDGAAHQLDVNEKGRHHLHGGSGGFGQRLWTIASLRPAGVTLVLVSEDGDMGYPGRLVAACSYDLLEPATLRVELATMADRPTPVNLTTHGYFNLDPSVEIGSHELMIAADFVTPTDAALIPTGEFQSVANSPYDFRGLRPIGASQPLKNGTIYDVNYVLNDADGRIRHAATLLSRRSGIGLELWTTEPGLQFYDGHKIDVPVEGLDGIRYGPRAGLCLEPQRFPDGPNRSHFPPCILRPGSVSHQVSELRFSVL